MNSAWDVIVYGLNCSAFSVLFLFMDIGWLVGVYGRWASFFVFSWISFICTASSENMRQTQWLIVPHMLLLFILRLCTLCKLEEHSPNNCKLVSTFINQPMQLVQMFTFSVSLQSVQALGSADGPVRSTRI